MGRTTSAESKSLPHDQISNLPDEILHKILLLLPIKTIAQTSLLSKHWKNLWYTFPYLDFVSVSSPETAIDNFKFGDAITQIMSIRDKHSDIKTLRFSSSLRFPGLSKVIHTAVKHHVHELDIAFVNPADSFKFPNVTSDSIRVLKLHSFSCGFRLPLSRILMKSGCLRKLHTLSLSNVVFYIQSAVDLFTPSSFPLLKKLHMREHCCRLISEDGSSLQETCFNTQRCGLKHLRISCKKLEDLSLENFSKLDRLEISSPELERLKILYCFDSSGKNNFLKLDASRLRIMSWSYNADVEDCLIEGLDSLHDVSIGSLCRHKNLSNPTVGNLSSMSKLLSGLSKAKRLTIERECYEMLLETAYLANALFRPFLNLKTLELHTGFYPSVGRLLSNPPIPESVDVKVRF